VYGAVPPLAATVKLPDEPAQMAAVGGVTAQASGSEPRAKMVPVNSEIFGQVLQSKVKLYIYSPEDCSTP
jgi:hypothetical protein